MKNANNSNLLKVNNYENEEERKNKEIQNKINNDD
jgi:hypothetical protein